MSHGTAGLSCCLIGRHQKYVQFATKGTQRFLNASSQQDHKTVNRPWVPSKRSRKTRARLTNKEREILMKNAATLPHKRKDGPLLRRPGSCGTTVQFFSPHDRRLSQGSAQTFEVGFLKPVLSEPNPQPVLKCSRNYWYSSAPEIKAVELATISAVDIRKLFGPFP
jgi:hypothetical protein